VNKFEINYSDLWLVFCRGSSIFHPLPFLRPVTLPSPSCVIREGAVHRLKYNYQFILLPHTRLKLFFRSQPVPEGDASMTPWIRIGIGERI
jgi:hypothetical protein